MGGIIQFYKSVLKKISKSKYEKAIADRYAQYLRNSAMPESEPFLIPELRLLGLRDQHLCRLDFWVLNPHVMSYTGFELSPHSTHSAVSGIRSKTQKAISEDLAKTWESDIDKRNCYFADFGISTVTFTDGRLADLDSCFADMMKYLSARSKEPPVLVDVLASFDEFDLDPP